VLIAIRQEPHDNGYTRHRAVDGQVTTRECGMLMKETENSLRWYFLLAGGTAVLSALDTIGSASMLPPMRAGWTIAIWFPRIAHLVLGIAWVAAGITLKQALATDPTWIKRVLIAAGGVLVFELVLIWYTRERQPPLEGI
jgi:hypothetical protein